MLNQHKLQFLKDNLNCPEQLDGMIIYLCWETCKWPAIETSFSTLFPVMLSERFVSMGYQISLSRVRWCCRSRWSLEMGILQPLQPPTPSGGWWWRSSRRKSCPIQFLQFAFRTFTSDVIKCMISTYYIATLLKLTNKLSSRTETIHRGFTHEDTKRNDTFHDLIFFQQMAKNPILLKVVSKLHILYRFQNPNVK